MIYNNMKKRVLTYENLTKGQVDEKIIWTDHYQDTSFPLKFII